MLQKCFGEPTLSRTQVFEWHKAFSEGREVVENLPHASRPSTPVNDDNIEKVKKIVLENRRVGTREVAEARNIYLLRGTWHESIQAIKRNSLKVLKTIPAEAYKKCLENWINRWHACIGSKGTYFKGDNKDLH